MPAGSTCRRWQDLTDVELDNLVVASLADSFRTEVPTEHARMLGRECEHEMNSLIVFAPRIWFFGHRHSLSLRHPRVSYSTWAHRIMGGQQRDAYDVHEVSVSSEALMEDRAPCARKWQAVAGVYKTLLDNSPELEEARRRIVHHPLVQDAVLRIWRRLVDVEAVGAPRPDHSCGFWAQPRGAMSPMQYIFFEVRLAQTLLPDCPLVSVDLLDVFERDMLLDMHRPETLSSCLPVAGSDDATSYAADYDEAALAAFYEKLDAGSLNTNPLESEELRNGGAVDSHVYDTRFQEHIWAPSARVRDYRWLPNISFERFMMSMMELSDNWTSTSNPTEHAAFLLDVYERIFTLDWSAQADTALVKAAVKQKLPVLGGGSPVFAARATQSAASVAQKRLHRRESEAQVLAMNETTEEGHRTDLTMEEVMKLPTDVRDEILDGTSPMVVTEGDIDYELEAMVARRRPPVVQVRYIPQYHLTTSASGAASYARGNRTFRTVPRMLFTLTAEPDLQTAVRETSGRSLPRNPVETKQPNVRFDRPASGGGRQRVGSCHM